MAAQTVAPLTVERIGLGAALVHVIPAIDTNQHSKLGLITTRVDAEEQLDRTADVRRAFGDANARRTESAGGILGRA